MCNRTNSRLDPVSRQILTKILIGYREDFEETVELPVEQIEVSLYYLLYDICEKVGLSDHQKFH